MDNTLGSCGVETANGDLKGFFGGFDVAFGDGHARTLDGFANAASILSVILTAF